MFSKINHIAIVSENYALLPRFYEAVFGMKNGSAGRAAGGVTVGDGYVGINFNPRRAGRMAGLDHFGIQVDDCETVFDRMRKKYPTVKWLKRPSSRPFAGISCNDPDGNVFDLQKDMSNRAAIYVQNDGKVGGRFVHHVAMRTMNPDQVAEFYSEVFELVPANKKEGDKNHYLSDGHVTLVIMPWQIEDYDATGIITPGMDHIGMKVESVEAVKEIQQISDKNPYLTPAPLATGPEGEALEKLFARKCPIGQYRFADPDGVLLDIHAD